MVSQIQRTPALVYGRVTTLPQGFIHQVPPGVYSGLVAIAARAQSLYGFLQHARTWERVRWGCTMLTVDPRQFGDQRITLSARNVSSVRIVGRTDSPGAASPGVGGGLEGPRVYTCQDSLSQNMETENLAGCRRNAG